MTELNSQDGRASSPPERTPSSSLSGDGLDTERLRRLAEAGRILAGSLDWEVTVQAVARLVVPSLADWCAVDVPGESLEAPTRLVAVAHADPAKVEFARELRERYPADPSAPNGVHHILRTGQSVFIPIIPQDLLEAGAKDADHLRVIRELDLRSAISVPLTARGRVLGVLTLVNTGSRRAFDESDLLFAKELARQAALALDNAELFAEARRQEAQLRLAMDAGGMGNWEFDLRRQRVRWSAAIETMHGLPVGSFAGTFEAYQQDIHPEDRAQVMQSIAEVLRDRTNHHLVYRIVRPDGAVRWLEAHGRLMDDENGEPERMVGVCSDITERRQREEDARRLEQERRAARHAALRGDIGQVLASAAPLPEILQSCATALTRHLPIHQAALWLAGVKEPVATDGDALDAAGLRAPAVVELVARTQAERRVLSTTDGPPGAGALTTLPLADDAQTVGALLLLSTEPLARDRLAALGLVADVLCQGVQRHQAQAALAAQAEELRRSNSELQQFAYVASHDLQEPLRMVASYTQLLARRYKGRLDKDADDFIHFAVDGVTRMQQLINDLLAYSRVGTRGTEFLAVPLNTAVEEALANLSMAAQESGATVEVGTLPTIQGDRGQLVQLFQNLVSNAIKFHSEQPPRISINARRDGKCWEVEVRDNGIGISPEYFERVFIIFQRLHGRGEYPGNGIGLALCKKIVERHGGRIWIESAPGAGTTFHFTFPASDVRPQ